MEEEQIKEELAALRALAKLGESTNLPGWFDSYILGKQLLQSLKEADSGIFGYTGAKD